MAITIIVGTIVGILGYLAYLSSRVDHLTEKVNTISHDHDRLYVELYEKTLYGKTQRRDDSGRFMKKS
jgi:hypothetical protein